MSDIVLPTRDAALLADALTSALTSASGIASRPGQLRAALGSSLGPSDAARLRGWIHQLVVGSEEHLPARLKELAPLSAPALERLAADLAVARGWSPESARQITDLWAGALGLWGTDRSAAAEHPSFPSEATPTMLPEQFGWPSQPAAFAAPPGPSLPPAAFQPVEWPASKRRFLGLKRPADGNPPLAAAQAYAGMDVLAFAAAVTVLLILVIVALIIFLPAGGGGSARAVIGAPAILIAALLRRRLQAGLLIARVGGLEFTEFDARMRRPKPDTTVLAPWSEVSVTPGPVSRVDLSGRRIQLGPRNRPLAAALASQVAVAARAHPMGPL